MEHLVLTSDNETLKMIGDEVQRKIFLELQKRPLSFSEITKKLNDIPQTTIHRKMQHLQKNDLISKSFTKKGKYTVSHHYTAAFKRIQVSLGRGKVTIVYFTKEKEN